jgi:hypothetical protein
MQTADPRLWVDCSFNSYKQANPYYRLRGSFAIVW